MFSYLRKTYTLLHSSFKRKIPLLVGSYLILSLLEAVGIILIFPITALIVNPHAINQFSFYKTLALYLPHSVLEYLIIILPPLMVLAFIIKNIVSMFVSRWQIYLINNQSKDLTLLLYERYATMNYLDSFNRDSSFLNYTVLSAGSVMYTSYVTPVAQIIADILTICFLMLMMLSLSFQAVLFSLPLMMILSGSFFALTKSKLKQAGHENRIYSERLVRIIKETFSNFKEFKVLNRFAYFQKRFFESREKTKEFQSKQMTYVILNRYATELLIVLITTVIAYIILLNHSRTFALAQLSLYAMIAVRLLPTITRISTSLQTMKTAESAIDLLLDEKKSFLSTRKSSFITPGELIQKPTIEFNQLCFTYPGSCSVTLKNINCVIYPNTCVGLVGKTGSGKTTLVDIILGLIPVQEDSLKVNGCPLQSILPVWKNQLGYVPQEISFIDATLKENIAYGIPEEEINLARIEEVIAIAELKEEVSKMPQGLDTLLQENASNLSGGQKQRVGIARALYNLPSLLVLDEATSALDVETEAKISTTIHQIKQHCTVIIIAHRLSTIKECDNILFLDQGELIDQGDFETLSKINPKFNQLIELSDVRRKAVITSYDHITT